MSLLKVLKTAMKNKEKTMKIINGAMTKVVAF